MNAKEWAEKLNGREYHSEVTPQEESQMVEDDIVAIYGAGNNLYEIVGAVDEEVVYSTEDKMVIVVKGEEIKVIWDKNGNPFWTYETAVPHETFDIYDKGKLYCKGIVFKLRTNFEKIKAMNIEELAEFIAAIAARCNDMTHEYKAYGCERRLTDNCPLQKTENCSLCGISNWLKSKDN